VEALQANGRVGEYSAVIAEHYALSGETTLAADWYTKAGERAKAQGTPLESRTFFDRALEYIPPSDRERRWRALLGRDEVLGLLGESEARQQDDEALLAIAREMKDDDRLAEAYYRRGGYVYTMGDDQQALKFYEASLEAAHQAGNQSLEALVLALKVVSQTRLGEINAAALTAREALALAETLDEDTTMARVLMNLAVHYSGSGDIAKAAQLYIQLVETTHRLDERLGEAIALSNLGYNYVLLGIYDPAMKALEESIQLSESIGARHQSIFTRLNLGLAYWRNGDGNAARQELEHAINELQYIGDKFGFAAGCFYLGLVFEESGDLKDASQYYKKAQRIFDEIGVRGYACDALAGLARCSLLLGQLEEANQLANRTWKELKANGAKGTEFPILLYKSCADIFDALEYTGKARTAIEAGYTELMHRANKISDPTWRKSYLENVPEHCAVVERWEELSIEPIKHKKGDGNDPRKEIQS
jgi:tetratricopeptide (TPR) repeat protein